jgi:hypothetical protein
LAGDDFVTAVAVVIGVASDVSDIIAILDAAR